MKMVHNVVGQGDSESRATNEEKLVYTSKSGVCCLEGKPPDGGTSIHIALDLLGGRGCRFGAVRVAWKDNCRTFYKWYTLQLVVEEINIEMLIKDIALSWRESGFWTVGSAFNQTCGDYSTTLLIYA